MQRLGSRLLTIVLAVLLVIGGGICGYLIYSTTKEAVVHAQFELPAPPEIVPVKLAASDQDDQGVEDLGRSRESPLAQALSQPQVERVNILLMGLDVPDADSEPARTDTIMIISVDPTGGPVSILSVPRDLWLPIGPYGENRINTAYFLGEVKDYPGGGPGLLRATIEQNLGIPIDYYVCVDFEGFRQLVDELGGVTVEVEHEIYDAAYPDGNGGVKTIHIPAGSIRMDGELALQYARSRHMTDDFDRAARQQRLVMAIRDEVLSRESISSLMTKLPSLYDAFSAAVRTDLSLEDMMHLAHIASRIDLKDVQNAVIDHTMTKRYITDRGWDVLLPIPERIEPVVERLMRAPSGSTVPSSEFELEPSPQVSSEKATILVVNGSGRPGLAEAAADYLKAQGFLIVGCEDLDRGDYSSSIMVVHSDKPGTVAALAAALGLHASNTRIASGKTDPQGADVKIILGQDFELPSD